MSDAGKAVFLSYASQDAEAARKICEALRAAGVEVWFDQSELRGGDSWDAKIRKQIKECALFMPVISASTDARLEGYFRREWKQAIDRTHDMAEEKTFLVPVVIDATPDATTHVPEKFHDVQWTRLPGGETTGSFAERVRALLSNTSSVGRDRLIPPKTGEVGSGDSALQPRHMPRWVWAVAGLVIAGGATFVALRPHPVATAPTTVAEKLPEAVVAPGVAEARALIARARPLYEDLDSGTRADFEAAEQMLKRALELAPMEGEVWAFYSHFCNNYYGVGMDRTPEREAEIKRTADRAIKLAPDSDEARYAWANCYRRYDSTKADALQLMREVVARRPGDHRFLRGLAACLSGPEQAEEALAVLDRAIALPGSDTRAWGSRASILRGLGRFDEEEAALDHSLAVRSTPRTLVRKALILATRHGDLEQARLTLDRVPGDFLLEDRGTYAAALLALWGREGGKCLKVLSAFPRDFMDDASGGGFSGPTGLLAGFARYLDGKPDAARLEWQEALRVLEKKLADRRASVPLLRWKAILLAMTGHRTEVESALRAYEQLGGMGRISLRAQVQIWLGDIEQALTTLETAIMQPGAIMQPSDLMSLRYDPVWEPLRGNPRFEALLKKPEVKL